VPRGGGRGRQRYLKEDRPCPKRPADSGSNINKESVAGSVSATEPGSVRRGGCAPEAPKKHSDCVQSLAVLVGVRCSCWRYLSSYESTDDAQVDVHLYPVSARIFRYVVKVNVDDNQYVQKGTVLVEIDPKDFESRSRRRRPISRVPKQRPDR